jgi:hypothetical protein
MQVEVVEKVVWEALEMGIHLGGPGKSLEAVAVDLREIVTVETEEQVW